MFHVRYMNYEVFSSHINYNFGLVKKFKRKRKVHISLDFLHFIIVTEILKFWLVTYFGHEIVFFMSDT